MSDILTTTLDELQPRKGKNQAPTRTKYNAIGNKATISRTVRGAPEVMIKIASSGKNMQTVRRNIDYIGRHGDVAVEDENGNQYTGKNARDEALYDWRDIPESGNARRESMHVIFSMPAGTPRNEVTQAVRAFAAKEWDDYRYLFAQHNDEKHAHVHVVLSMNPIRGTKRLNPRKADLQRWRERFAEQLIARGIDANATPRVARGVTKRGKLQAVEAMKERAKQSRNPELAADVTKSAIKAARAELDGKPYAGIPRKRLEQGRAAVVAQYGHAIEQLIAGNEADKQLARDTVEFVQKLPPIVTRHDELVERLREATPAQAPQAEQGKTPLRGLER